uniref:Low affinity immunoglobulin epsilon Fc receptor n=1 Tax=Magallana gigas TaxID=29159 RepID=K1QAX1_MAGGI
MKILPKTPMSPEINSTKWLSKTFQMFIKNFWIGGTDAMKEGNWVWMSTQDPLDYNGWNPGEPNNGVGAACMAMANHEHYHWNDDFCTKILCIGVIQAQVKEAGICPSHWKHHGSNCYLIVTGPMLNWRDAVSTSGLGPLINVKKAIGSGQTVNNL